MLMGGIPTRLVEVRLCASPIEELLWTRFTDGVEVSLYGGYHDGPLNGGRCNFSDRLLSAEECCERLLRDALRDDDVVIASKREQGERSACDRDAGAPNISRHRYHSLDDLARWLDGRGLEGACRLIRGHNQQIAGTWSKPIDILVLDADHNQAAVHQGHVDRRPWLAPGRIVVLLDSNQSKGPLNLSFFGPAQVVEEPLVNSSCRQIVERFASTTVAGKLRLSTRHQ